MPDNVETKIIAKDEASPAFKKVGQAADQMGDEIERSARRAGRSLTDLRRDAAEIGAGFGALLLASSKLGRSFVEQERQIMGIRRTYGDAADDLLRFADELQRTTAFSDDAARSAILSFGTLARNYGLTAEQIKQLTAVTADLAAATGFDLADAASRVQAAIRGEAEAAEALGLTMNQQAIDRQNLTLTMSNQEAAQFRLNALFQQAAFAEGAAAEMVQTHAGAAQQLVNRLQDLGQEFGGVLGPAGQYLSVMADLGLALPLVTAGVSRLAVGARALATSLGPAGLVGAAGLAAFGIGQLIALLDSDYRQAVQDAGDATRDLADLIAQLSSAGDPRSLSGSAWAQALESAFAVIRSAPADIGPLNDELRVLQDRLKELGAQGEDTSAVQARIAELQQQIALYQEMARQFGSLSNAVREQAETQAALATILADTGPAADGAREAVGRYLQLYAEGKIDLADAATMIQDIASTLPDLNRMAIAGSQGVGALGEAAATAASQLDELDKVLKRFDEPLLAPAFVRDVETIFSATTDQARAMQEEFRRLVEAGTPMEALIPIADQMADAVRREEIHLRATSEAMSRTVAAHRAGEQAMAQTAETAEETEARIAALTRSLGPQIEAAHGTNVAWQALDASQQELIDRLVQGQLAMLGYAQALGVAGTAAQALAAIDLGPRGADKALGLAAGMQSAATGMDAVLGLFKTIDQLQSRGRDAAEIAKDLVGEPGVYATVDKLLEEGRISLTRYTMAVEAGYRIQERQAEIEADLNVIRAKQLPLLDEAQEQYAKLIDQISHMDATQQMVTLGFMDSTEAMKAQQAVMLAAQAAYGELGEAGEETAERIIQGAVAADPVLKAMLEDLGLISVGADGTVTVNFPEGEGINELLEQTNQNLQDLAIAIDLIDGKPDLQITVEYLENEARKKIDDTKAKMDNLDGTTATVSVHANTSPFWSAVNAINGSYVGTVYVGVEAIRQLGGFQPYATGGTVPYEAQVPIPRAALGRTLSGGSLAMVGEDGPEIVHLPAGAQVTNAVATRSRLRSVQRTAGDVVITGPVYVVSNTPQEFAREMAKYRRSETRR